MLSHCVKQYCHVERGRSVGRCRIIYEHNRIAFYAHGMAVIPGITQSRYPFEKIFVEFGLSCS